MTYWKTLRADGRSISDKYGAVFYPLPHDGKPGAWITVPGLGAFVACSLRRVLGGGLFAGGIGDILVEVEARAITSNSECLENVKCARHVRILRIVPWTDLPSDQWMWRCRAACYVPGLSDADRRELVMAIPAEEGEWRHWAAHNVPGLSDADRRELVMAIPAEEGELRHWAAHTAPGLSDADRRELSTGRTKQGGAR